MSKKYRSDAMANHETMAALHKVGAIGKPTMRRFDDACLTPVFAGNLNVTPDLVSKCGRREKRPSGPRSKSCP
jgi:putative transcriptional regulator